MGIYHVKEVIKKTRKAMGYTHEELADCICSVETLSRIENGRRDINHQNYIRLMKALRQDTRRYRLIFPNSVSVPEYSIYLLRHLLSSRAYEAADQLLYKIEHHTKNKHANKETEQYLIRARAVIDRKFDRISLLEYLEKLEEAAKLTIQPYSLPAYQMEQLFFTNEELRLLCNIASAKFNSGQRKEALEQFAALYASIKIRGQAAEENAKTCIMILDHYARCLLAGQEYDKCMYIITEAGKLCIKWDIGKYMFLFYYYSAVCTKEKMDDKEAEFVCKKYIYLAYQLCGIYHMPFEAEQLKQYFHAAWNLPIMEFTSQIVLPAASE